MTPDGAPMKVLCVFGTRPEAIKMAPVVRALQEHESIDCRVCVTAQHREMLDDVLELFEIVPDYDLDVMRDNQSPSQVVAVVLSELETILRAEKPRWMLVQGDTVTTMAAAMAAFFERIPVGHIEAGLRTWDRWNPFPEEMARSTTRIVADLHFASTPLAERNLLKEGVSPEDIVVTGNTVIDALMDVTELRPDRAGWEHADLVDPRKRLILVTAHRRESFGEPLLGICRAIHELAATYRNDIQFVFPVHPNPQVQEPVRRLLSGIANVSLVKPLDYLSLARLMHSAFLILTDSGGIQEEAPSLKVPVLVLREVTERSEAVEIGAAKLVGTDTDFIIKHVSRLLDDPAEHAAMVPGSNPYGDGQASGRIVEMLIDRTFGATR